jgi:hypothetical protein
MKDITKVRMFFIRIVIKNKGNSIINNNAKKAKKTILSFGRLKRFF